MIPTPPALAAQTIPLWAWILLIAALSGFSLWNLAVALGLLPKPGARWGQFGQGPPVTRPGHTGWTVMGACLALSLFLGQRTTLVWQWFVAGFAFVLVTGFIDLALARSSDND